MTSNRVCYVLGKYYEDKNIHMVIYGNVTTNAYLIEIFGKNTPP